MLPRQFGPPPPPPPPSAAVAMALSVPRVILDADRSPLGKLSPALRTFEGVAARGTVVSVRILLRDASADTLVQLRKAGLEIVQPAGKDLMITGRIAGGRLNDLAAIAAVRYVVEHK